MFLTIVVFMFSLVSAWHFMCLYTKCNLPRLSTTLDSGAHTSVVITAVTLFLASATLLLIARSRKHDNDAVAASGIPLIPIFM